MDTPVDVATATIPSLSIEQLVRAVTKPETSPVSTVACADRLLHLVTSTIEANPDLPSHIFEVLFRLPISKNPVVAFRVITLLLRLLSEGPAKFTTYTVSNQGFLPWVESSWTPDATAKKTHPHARSFLKGDIALFANILASRCTAHITYSTSITTHWMLRVSSLAASDLTPPAAKIDLFKVVSHFTLSCIKLVHFILSAAAAEHDHFVPDILKLAVPNLVVEICKTHHILTWIFFAANQPLKSDLRTQLAHVHSSARTCLNQVSKFSEVVSKIHPACNLNLPEELALPSDEQQIIESLKAFRKKKKKKLITRKDEPTSSSLDNADISRSLQSSNSDEHVNGVNVDERPLPTSQKLNRQRNDAGPAFRQRGYSDMSQVKSSLPYHQQYATESGGLNNGYARDMWRRRQQFSESGNRYQEVPEDEEYEDEEEEQEEEEEKVVRKKKKTIKKKKSASLANGHASDEAAATSSKARKAKKSIARNNSDETSIPFDREPTAAKKPPRPVNGKKNGKFAHSDTSDDANSDYSGGSKEALAAAAQGRKTPSINSDYEIAPYEVQYGPQIGSGGFGVVYKAKFRQETVAVKKIHAHALSNANSVQEFQSEVAVLCTLRHPNILRFVGACTKPPNLMILTEFMGRGTLFDLLHQSQTRVTWSMRRKFALDTCRGMKYLHDSKLLHRDLKSSNLMLDNDYNCKVGDFGLTRISKGAAAVQMTGQCGTFQYMAVEVLANKPYSEKADVFSFGILLWEMIARKLPYFGMQPMQVGIAVLQQGLRPTIPPKTPAPLARVMTACWDNDPNKRPSFTQLVEALEKMPE